VDHDRVRARLKPMHGDVDQHAMRGLLECRLADGFSVQPNQLGHSMRLGGGVRGRRKPDRKKKNHERTHAHRHGKPPICPSRPA